MDPVFWLNRAGGACRVEVAFAATLQHGLDHGRGDAEVAGVQRHAWPIALGMVGWHDFRGSQEGGGGVPAPPRLLVVYGPSGSGKSSLTRAGLVPALAKRPPGGRGQARIAILVPGSQPPRALASVLARIATNDPLPVRKTRELAEELALPNAAGEHDGLQRIDALLPEADV